MHTQIKKFYLQRNEDESGISGIGRVAIGVILPSGRCVIEWLSQIHSINIYDTIEEVSNIHGHGGKTIVEYIIED